MTPGQQTQIAALDRIHGGSLSPEFVAATYQLLAPTAPSPEHVRRDLAYGGHKHQKFDRYGLPDKSDIIVYIHGGGFVAGSKGNPDSPFFANIGAWAEASGMQAVVPDYRLAPDHPYPDARDDITSVVGLLHRERPDARIWLVGQSAGAAHVADALAFGQHQNVPLPVAGVIMFSGIYDPPSAGTHPGISSYYGAPSERTGNLPQLGRIRVPALYTVSQYDPPLFRQQAQALRDACPQADLRELPHHNHLSTALSIGGPQDDVGAMLLDFIRQNTSAHAA